jgi:Bacterial aa3 type cytochrome c oxidase subunit IV
VERDLPESRTLEPTTVAANDDEHERTYSGFLVVVAIAVVHVAGVLIGLATGGVLGDWVAAALIILIATVTALYSLGKWTTAPSVLGFVVVLGIFATFGLVG